MKKVMGNKLAILIFILPAILLYTIVVFYPILQTVLKSTYQWDGLNLGKFVGFGNYIELFTDDSSFKTALVNGLIFPAITATYQIGLGTILALLLTNKKLKGRGFFRSAFFIPSVLSVVIVCKLWLTMMNSEHGLINKIFSLLGISYSQNWLAKGTTAIIAISFVCAWQGIGNTILLLYSSIKSIPEQYYEAAVIDGASTVQAHVHITMPLLAETYKFCLILIVSGGMRAFDHMFVMTGGGPGTSTYTLSYLMYSSAFRNGEYGYACAVAVTLVLECLVFTFIINKFVARERIVY